MTINFTPAVKQLRKFKNYKLILVGTIILVMVAGVVVATFNINSIVVLEKIIEGSRFF